MKIIEIIAVLILVFALLLAVLVIYNQNQNQKPCEVCEGYKTCKVCEVCKNLKCEWILNPDTFKLKDIWGMPREVNKGYIWICK